MAVNLSRLTIELTQELEKSFGAATAFSVEIRPYPVNSFLHPYGLQVRIQVEQWSCSQILPIAEIESTENRNFLLEALARHFRRELQRIGAPIDRQEEKKLRAIALVSSAFDLQFSTAKGHCDRWVERNFRHTHNDPHAWDELYRLLSCGLIQLIEGRLCRRVSPIAWIGIDPAMYVDILSAL